VTVTTAVAPVTPSMVLAIVDEALGKDFRDGVIGVRARPDRALDADHRHRGQIVRVRAAESALAVRELLVEPRDDGWLVVVTDRDDEDLGPGILAHFVFQRLRNADPWEAVRNRFEANGIDPTLTSAPRNRELAAALLAAGPPTGWPAAPAGVLTRTHALGAVAELHLGFRGDTADALGVLRWSMSAESVSALAALRRDIGDQLADTTLDWIAGRAGAAEQPIRGLLAQGNLADVVPLGVVLRLLTSPAADPATTHQAALALARLEKYWSAKVPTAALAALGQAADTLLSDLVHDRRADADVQRVIDRADALLTDTEAGDLARGSDLLASGLRARFAVLADALQRAVGPQAGQASVDAVENAWTAVDTHRLGAASALRGPFEAAVRLIRWLALPEPDAPPGGPEQQLGGLARRHIDVGAWVDAAVNDAFGGVDAADLSPALHAVVTAAQERRRRQEREFAAALKASTATASTGDGVPSDGGTVWYLERLLSGAVLPLARRTRVLLLVMDGMSAATATELVADATHRLGWSEAALPRAAPERRAAALSVLPSVTEVSRASMLCGRLVRGQQATELKGYAELTAQGGKITARLFHKKGVDTTAAGWSVSHDVREALEDDTVQLVTIVLNTIDDALDRSDPAGTAWTADAVKHLEPLLERASAAGLTVVMTADHGHVVERRQGTQRAHPSTSESTSRNRAVDGTVETGEVEVSGPRVVTADHQAVLAVDETLRYAALKAGYHGGGSAAEVVVPVVVLVPGESRNEAGLPLLPPQEPAWWIVAANSAQPPVPLRPVDRPVARGVTKPKSEEGGTLFDLTPAPAPVLASQAPGGLGLAVVSSAAYKAQRKVSARLIVSDDQVARIIDALAVANGSRLPPALAAQALGIPQTRLRGALSQVQQLLNVEGYAVVAAEPVTGAAVLDVRLLEDQFGVLS
jgi:PglZ domain-containing protein